MTSIRSSVVLCSATLTAVCSAQLTMTPLTSFSGDGWLAPGEIGWLSSSAATERSIGYSRTANELYVASRSTGVNIRILNAATGEEINVANNGLDMTGVSGGIFAINCVGVAGDGVIYGCNLASPVSVSAPFKIYRWQDSNSPPELVFTSNIITSGRMGDTFDVIGSGGNTRLVAGESNNAGTGPRNGYAIFTAPPPDSGIEFSGLLVGFPGANPAAGDFKLGITFTDSDSVIGSQGGSGGFKLTNFVNATGTFDRGWASTTPTERPMDFIMLGGRPLLATLETNGNTTPPNPPAAPTFSTVRIYDLTDPQTPVLAASGRIPGTFESQGAAAGTGAVQWAPLTDTTANLYALSTNNGIQAFAVSTSSEITPPSIATAPASRTVFERGRTTFTVGAAGTPPFTYQWLKGGEEIPGATGVSYTINPVTAASAGEYSCRVSNAAPAPAESVPAVLTVDPGVNTGALTPLWQLPPGARSYLTEGDLQRGLAYHPGNNRLYLVSRTSATAATLHILDGAGGTDLGVMDVSGISGGNFVLNKVGVASDGVILACNLSNTTDGSGFKIYQWPDDHPATPPGVVYEGNPAGQRIGDSFAVRGSGTDTQCLAGTNAASSIYHFVLFTANEFGFMSEYPVTVAGAADRAFSLSIAFGPNNTVWGKSNTGGITVAALTFEAGSAGATLLTTYGDSVIPTPGGALAVDGVNGFLAHIHTGNSDNVRLYQMPLPFPAPPPAGFTWLDQEFYTTDNANDNNVGQLAFGSGRLFALNTNNGLAAYTIAGVEPPAAAPVITDVTQTGGSVVFKLRGTPGKTYLIEKSAELAPAASWSPDGTVTQNAAEETVTRAIPAGTPRLYWRAREQ
jgi:hypothetical protein